MFKAWIEREIRAGCSINYKHAAKFTEWSPKIQNPVLLKLSTTTFIGYVMCKARTEELKDSNPPHSKGKVNSWLCFAGSTKCSCACSTQHFSFNLGTGIKKGENVLWKVFFPGLFINKCFVLNYGLPLVLVFWERVDGTVFVLLVKMWNSPSIAMLQWPRAGGAMLVASSSNCACVFALAGARKSWVLSQVHEVQQSLSLSDPEPASRSHCRAGPQTMTAGPQEPGTLPALWFHQQRLIKTSCLLLWLLLLQPHLLLQLCPMYLAYPASPLLGTYLAWPQGAAGLLLPPYYNSQSQISLLQLSLSTCGLNQMWQIGWKV